MLNREFHSKATIRRQNKQLFNFNIIHAHIIISEWRMNIKFIVLLAFSVVASEVLISKAIQLVQLCTINKQLIAYLNYNSHNLKYTISTGVYFFIATFLNRRRRQKQAIKEQLSSACLPFTYFNYIHCLITNRLYTRSVG